MAVRMERFGVGGSPGRNLLLLELDAFEALPTVEIPSPHFVFLVVADASNVDAADIGTFAEDVLANGAVSILTSGPDCERVHDIFDETIVGTTDPEPAFSIDIMTTWHADKPMSDALWQFLFCAVVGDEFEETCRSGVAIVVSSPSKANDVRIALRDPEDFYQRVLAENGAA